MGGLRCEYTFDPEDHDPLHPDAMPGPEVLDGSTWQCPHVVLEGRDRCLAHTEPADRPAGHDETEWLLDAIVGGGTDAPDHQRNRFFGGVFRELELETFVEGSEDRVLDLRFARVGALRCTGTPLTKRIDCSGGTVERLEMDGEFDSLRAVGSELGIVYFDEVKFDRIDCRDAAADSVSFRRGRAHELDLRNFEADEIRLDKSNLEHSSLDFLSVGLLRGHHASFDIIDLDNAACRTLDFYYADFGQADFRNVAAVDSVLKGASLEGAYFNGAQFEVANWIGVEIDNGHFSGARFEQASLHNAEIKEGGFSGTYFGLANFQDGVIGEADFEGATIEYGSFRNTEFRAARFVGTDCAGYLDLRDTVFGREIRIRPSVERPPSGALVDLTDSDVPDGTLGRPEEGRVVYDLENATVGRIRFESAAERHNMIEDIFFLRTRFEGFDFRDDDDIDLKQIGYDIHSMFDGVETFAAECLAYGPALTEARGTQTDEQPDMERDAGPARELSLAPAAAEYGSFRSQVASDLPIPESTERAARSYSNPPTTDLEYTYLLAKNGANAIHDNESSSQFFVREMLHRRRRYVELLAESRHPLRIGRYAHDWVKNSVLWWSSGYGERPSRVISMSIVIIAIFAVLYYAAVPGLYDSSLDYVSLSIGSFVTLIIGGVGDVPKASVRILTQVQAFFGAFLIAMFVFTLTRAIRR